MNEHFNVNHAAIVHFRVFFEMTEFGFLVCNPYILNTNLLNLLNTNVQIMNIALVGRNAAVMHLTLVEFVSSKL